MEPESLPTVQNAWVAKRRGHPSDALVFTTNHPVPSKLSDGDVLVKVQAAALNPVGYKLLKYLPNLIARRPLVPEHDFAGTIVRSTVQEFKPGDQVFGWIPAPLNMATSQGALSQYTRLPASHVVSRPDNITPTQAAGVPLVALTALYAIETVEEGKRVFINGGSSAVGTWAIMLAKLKGCHVTASASAKNEAYVKSFGADEFMDYTTSPLATQLSSNPPAQKYDVFFDAVGLNNADLYVASPDYLAPNGVFISSMGGPSAISLKEIREALRFIWWCFLRPSWAGGVKRSFKALRIKNDKAKLEAIRDYLATRPDVVRPVVDSVWPFSEILKAYDRLMSQRAAGKVIVRIEEGVP